MENIEFKPNGSVIVGTTVSRGQRITAVAQLCPGDTFSEFIGQQIVKYRIEIKQRKRDLANTREVISLLQSINERENIAIALGERKPWQVSKHWMRFIQEACEERNSQLENIAFAKAMVEVLTKTNGDFQEMRNIINAKNWKDEKKQQLIKEIDALERASKE